MFTLYHVYEEYVTLCLKVNTHILIKIYFIEHTRGVVSIPDPGRSHMPHAEQLSPCTTIEPVL